MASKPGSENPCWNLAMAYKRAWDKHKAEIDAAGLSPWYQALKKEMDAQEAVNRLLVEDADAVTVKWMPVRPVEFIADQQNPAGPNWVVIAPMVIKPTLKACECGVAITGGMHSDWCPLKDTDV